MRSASQLSRRLLAGALMLFAWASASCAQNIDERALRACLGKPDAERLQCYDAVVSTPAAQEPRSSEQSAGAPAPAQSDQAIPAKLSTADLDCLHRGSNTPLECHWELDAGSKRGAG